VPFFTFIRFIWKSGLLQEAHMLRVCHIWTHNGVLLRMPVCQSTRFVLKAIFIAEISRKPGYKPQHTAKSTLSHSGIPESRCSGIHSMNLSSVLCPPDRNKKFMVS
jgi:hypothetical protein